MRRKLSIAKRQFLEDLKANFGPVVTRKQIISFVAQETGQVFLGSRVPKNTEFPHWITNCKEARTTRGAYNLDWFLTHPANDVQQVLTPQVKKVSEDEMVTQSLQAAQRS